MTNVRPRIAVVMACYNRRETTLRCLRSLASQDMLNVDVAVYLLDDASPDGTGNAVSSEFPQVVVIQGTGDLFWGGGMRAAMLEASKSQFDFMLWLNDDVELDRGALRIVLEAYSQLPQECDPAKQILVGATRDPQNGSISYSGFRRVSRWHPTRIERVAPQDRSLTPCDTMNGNFVLVPSQLFERLGPIDEAYVHQLGDIDYGYRALKHGGGVWIAPSTIGTCSPNVGLKAYRDPSKSISERLRALRGPHGLPLKSWMTFLQRHAGPAAGVILLATYANAILRPRKSAT